MRILRLAILMGILLMVGACVKDPGPIPANMSRIKVVCSGFYLNSYEVYVIPTGGVTRTGPAQNLGCIFYDAVYFDVLVPPNSFDVYVGGMNYKTVTFNGTGEQVTVKITAVFVSYTGNV